MNKIVCYIILYLSFFDFVFAQNLIPNPSFEEAYSDSGIVLSFGNNFSCKDWNSPTKGTPDYFNSSRIGNFGCPKNYYGYLIPRTGIAYCGIIIKFNSASYEYIQVKLKSKLVKDSLYCISLFASIPKLSAFTTNEINCFFSSSKVMLNLNHEIINTVPYINLLTSKDNIKTLVWNQLTNYYKAKGDEEYIVIGMLNSNYSNTKISTSSKVQKGIYMFIDDVSLKLISDSTNCKHEESTINYNEALYKPLVLNNLIFEINKTDLKSTTYLELKKLAVFLKQNPKFKIEITGHTDNIGIEINNINLSKGRAKTVADYLMKEGVDNKNIVYKGLGSKAPLKPNNNEENRMQNR